MVEIPNIVKDKILRFIAELENNNIKIKKAYLFGSYANNRRDKWSDIDLALISDSFTGNRFEDKMKIPKYKAVVGWDISPMPFREEDFNDSYFERDEIIAKGIEIEFN